MPPHVERSTLSAPWTLRSAIIALSALVYWYWMMALHECGHVLHAWISEGKVVRVVLEPLAISRTDVEPNPSPMFVVWGGLVWGCVLPLAMWGVSVLAVKRVRAWTQGLAGFCLIANGLYLGTGAAMPVGDTLDLAGMGVPGWLMGVLGLPLAGLGLWLWHRLGRGFRTHGATRADALLIAALLVVTIGLMVVL